MYYKDLVELNEPTTNENPSNRENLEDDSVVNQENPNNIYFHVSADKENPTYTIAFTRTNRPKYQYL